MAAPNEMRADLRCTIIRLCMPFASTVPHHDRGLVPPVAHLVSLQVRDRVRAAVDLGQTTLPGAAFLHDQRSGPMKAPVVSPRVHTGGPQRRRMSARLTRRCSAT